MGNKLARAQIYILKTDGKGGKDDNDDCIEVCFNPKEYSLEKSVAWQNDKSFKDAPQAEFTGPSPMTLSVSLQFDTYEERVSVRRKYVQRIEKCVLMREGLADASDKQKVAPPVILFVWGNFTFKGVAETLSQKYTMFLSDGTPVRAECSLKIRNIIDKLPDEAPITSTGGGGGKSYTVQEGDRLDSIAATQLGDASRWTEIAMLNDIDDPTKLSKGQSLQLPD
jgi:hypothetical protein